MTLAQRIAIVTSSYPASPDDPSGHFVRTEALALARAGHEVTVLTGGGRGESAELVRELRLEDWGATGWPGIVPRLRERPQRALGLVALGLRLRRELARRGPFQRVIAHFLLPSAFPFLHGLTLDGAALEVVVHGSDARLLARLPRALGRRVLVNLLRRGATLRCVSSELLDELSRVYGASLAARAHVAEAALDLEGVPNRSAARAVLGVSATAQLLVVVGRLLASKRVETALSAASLLDGVELVVVGDGPELSRLAHAFPAVRFVGRVERSRALCWIAAADAVISASTLEGAPSAVREARALGVPVVAVASGDLADWATTDPELYVLAP